MKGFEMHLQRPYPHDSDPFEHGTQSAPISATTSAIGSGWAYDGALKLELDGWATPEEGRTSAPSTRHIAPCPDIMPTHVSPLDLVPEYHEHKIAQGHSSSGSFHLNSRPTSEPVHIRPNGSDMNVNTPDSMYGDYDSRQEVLSAKRRRQNREA
jgi:hypothetical protein